MTTGAQTITTLHIVLMAVLAVATIAAILWGMRLKRARKAGEALREAHEAAVEAAPSINTVQRQSQAQSIGSTPVVQTGDSAPTTGPAAASQADAPVTILKGLGPKVAARLAECGITTVGQIAALDADQAQAIDLQLGTFTGRIARDRWVEQARLLAAGDTAGFEAVFGRL